MANQLALPQVVASLLGAMVFWLQLSLGGLGILLIHDVTGGRWGESTRGFLRATLPTFYVVACAFIITALGSAVLYPWDQSPAEIAFFLGRGLLLFAVWIMIARGFEARLRSGKSTKAWSGGSLLVLLFTITFASMDWLMRLSKEWVSTGFGVIFIGGCLCAGFSLITFMSLLTFYKNGEAQKPLLIDLGNLVLMSIMFWAYVDFMQYLIIWSGQIPKETRWYAERSAHGWALVVAAAAFLNFAFPMLALLFRRFKKSTRLMLVLVLSVLLGRFLESFIWVAPVQSLSAAWGLALGLIAWAVVGAPWLGVYRSAQRRLPLLEAK